MSIKTFIEGLKKSFSFNKDFLRNLNHCLKCGESAFGSYCQICEMIMRYEEWEKKNGRR